MDLEAYNAFCAGLPATTHVVQWGGAHVWKVGGKVFAIAGWNDSDELAVTFKVSELAFDILREQPGLRPAPYLASRGMTWIQRVPAKPWMTRR
jgi:predicted DNA-binding protein (MmcQ/YjbR family)